MRGPDGHTIRQHGPEADCDPLRINGQLHHHGLSVEQGAQHKHAAPLARERRLHILQEPAEGFCPLFRCRNALRIFHVVDEYDAWPPA
jgi:hypothetical protein